MSEFIYRYRPTNSLFEFNELEKQQIFFAEPSKLNDPLEDYKDIFWNGDEILWKNLLKNYLLCLQNVYLQIRIGGEDHPITAESIPVFTTYDKLPTPEYKKKVFSLFQDFFERKEVKMLINGLLSREKIRRDELLTYLECIHPLCLQLVQKNIDGIDEGSKKREAQDSSLIPFVIRDDFFEVLKRSREEHPDINNLEDSIFEIITHSNTQVKLILQLNEPNKMPPNRKFYLIDFPSNYIHQLETLMFWPWYTACFTKTPNNSSMWGYYTDAHKGVCLKFKTRMIGKTHGLNLRAINGYGGRKGEISKHYSKQFYQLHEINYAKKLEPIDFFRSIGRLPYPDLLSQWYTNEENKLSPKIKDIISGQDSWRDKYWESFLNNIPIKTKEWSHEEEYRLLHYSMLEPILPEEDRTLNYEFNDLDGIIFGINTSDEDKIKIVKIIHDICKKTKRTDFNFYQAYYDNRNGKIENSPLSQIKFSFKENNPTSS